ncbi:MAG: hypothetical protein U9R19_10015 [Bacteroidota bacterium]|nr:hypothetical protein [Bacteroidota bacterium]
MRLIKKEYRKYWVLSVWVVIIGYLIFSFGVIGSNRNASLCSALIVEIDNDDGHCFVQEYEVLRLLKIEGIKVIGMPLIKINTTTIETIISRHPSIKKVAVYKTINGELKIDVQQPKPIIRIISKKGQSFYFDEDGLPMPASLHYTAHLLVATGNIPNVNFSSSDEKIETPEIFQQLYEMAKFINEEETWKAMFVQIYVNKKNKFELVPRIGNQKICFGGFENFKRKFAKLEALYTQGFSKYGWSKYSAIDLKFKNQVVCTRK